MDTLRTTILAAIVAVAAFQGCNKDNGGQTAPEQDTPEPQDLVTDSFTGYPSGQGACVDSYLTMTFSTPPQAGTSGEIRILDADGNVADMIDMADIAALSGGIPAMTESTVFTTAMDAVGSAEAGYRIVYYEPIRTEGNTIVIRPHSDKLEYGGTYRVEIDADAIIADGFDGVVGDTWTFTVKEAPEYDGEVSVGSRSCDFMTVQGAINYAMYCGQSREMTICVTDGIYREPLYIHNKNRLTIRGESRENTILRFASSNEYIPGVGKGVEEAPEPGEQVGEIGGRAVILVENCDLLCLENISLENSYGHGAQAEVIYFNCDNGRLIAKDCNLSSEQDTIELKGWCLFEGCTITGDVDFIWGYARAALFESCEIHSCDAGYIVQARCKKGDRGFVFKDCRITALGNVEDGSVYLARSGGNSSEYDNVTYIGCRMDYHISADGWYSRTAPTPANADPENGWKEYGNTNLYGNPLDVSGRYSGSIQLTESDAAALYGDREAIFADCPSGTEWAVAQ